MMDLDTRARQATDELLLMPRDLDAGLADLYRTRRHRALGKAVVVSVVMVLALAGVLVGQHIPHRPEPATPIHKWVIPVAGGNPSEEGAGYASVWVTVHKTHRSNVPGYVDRYDPATRRLVQEIQVGAEPAAAIPGFGSMWVSNFSDGTVSRIDPSTNTVLATIPVGSGPDQMAPADGGLWVATRNDAVKIDPTTNSIVETAAYPGHHTTVYMPGLGLDASSEGVWVTTPYGTVWRFSPVDGRLLATIRVLRTSNSDPGPVAINGDNVWVSNNTWKTVSGAAADVTPKNRRTWHLTDISAATDKIVARVTTGHYGVLGFLAQNRTLFIVGDNFHNHTSELIRTDWPYHGWTYARPLAENSTPFIDTHGALWIPTWGHRAVQILHDTTGRPDTTSPGG